MIAVLDKYVAGYHDTYPLTEQELPPAFSLMLLVEVAVKRADRCYSRSLFRTCL